MLAIDEVALGAYPQLRGPVGIDACDTGVGLDIALVRLLGPEGTFYDGIGLLEARFDVTVAVLAAIGDVGRRGGFGVYTAGGTLVSCSSGAEAFIASSTSVTCGSTS